MGGFRLLGGGGHRRHTPTRQHSKKKKNTIMSTTAAERAMEAFELQELQQQQTPPEPPEVKSAGGAFCSGLSRSDGSILRSVLGQPTRRPSLTISEWKYSGEDDHHAHAPKCARRRRSSFDSICSADASTLAALDSAASGLEREDVKKQQAQQEQQDSNHQQQHKDVQESSSPSPTTAGLLLRSRGDSKRRILNLNHSGRNATTTTTTMSFEDEEEEELNFQLARSRRLPGTWYFSSNHILVNKARTKRQVPALIRDSKIDDLAREIANILMENTLQQILKETTTISNTTNNNHTTTTTTTTTTTVATTKCGTRAKDERKRNKNTHKTKKKKQQHPENVVLSSGFDILEVCNPQEMITKLMNGPFRRVGYNFAIGKSIRGIHKHMMTNDVSCKNNMLDRRFEYFGMGTATHRGSTKNDTELYMVQLYVA